MAKNLKAQTVLPSNIALRLPNTDAGKAWLAQFEPEHHPHAARLLSALTLVSHNAFERALAELILEQVKIIDGPVALFATRETDSRIDFFAKGQDSDDPFKPLDAVGRGADLGSEARVATLIRNFCKAQPNKALNHPSLETMRKQRVRAVFVIDDFIGSGKRTADFITAMWQSKSIKSWHSRHETRFVAISYSGTEMGLARVRQLHNKPTVVIERDCPTFYDLPWREKLKQSILSLCDTYGRKTSRKGMRLGFKRTMAALVFEHGCPNNAPAILWAPQEDKCWQPLFPNRAVLPEHTSAFPPDITARNPLEVLADLQEAQEESENADRRAASTPEQIAAAQPLGITVITVLAMVARGVRSRAAMSYATGLRARECTYLLDQCVARGYLTGTVRLTATGRAELVASVNRRLDDYGVPSRGSDNYYPQQLRRLPDG